MLELSNSSIRCYERCPREYLYRFVLKYEPVKVSEAFRFGRLFHKGMEFLFQARAEELPTRDAVEFTIETLRLLPDVDPFDRIRTTVLVQTYAAVYPDVGIRLLANETFFEAPLLHPETGEESRMVKLKGVIDKVFDTPVGATIMEHKSSTADVELGSPYWRRLALDSQVSMYIMGARALGYNVTDCIYDVVVRPPSRVLSTPVERRRFTKAGKLYANQREFDETESEYETRIREYVETHGQSLFQRAPVTRTESDIHSAMMDVWHTAEKIVQSYFADKWPRNTGSCWAPGKSLCDFFGVCTGETSLDNEKLYKLRRSKELPGKVEGELIDE